MKKRQTLARDIGLPDAVNDAISFRHADDPSGLNVSEMLYEGELDIPGNDHNPNIFYSFDARHSPDFAGETVLSTALAQALERFDEKETDRIIREYDFVPKSEGSLSDAGSVQLEQDEDYEFVEASHA